MSLKDDLTNLVKSPGWLQVCRYARDTWDEQLAQHINSAAGDRDDAIALQKIRQVIAAKKAVADLLAWPEAQIQRLDHVTEREHQPVLQSRRGMP